MIKKLLLTCLLALPFGVAMADDLPYMTFETSDGGSKTISVEGLKITFSDGTMTAQNTDTEYSVPVASLTKMYFASTNTGIAEVGDAPVMGEVYNLQGIRVGTAAPTGDIQGVPTGVYVIKRGGVTRKVVVK
ncbi:MAG: hypothetical protein IJ692_00020 [Alloprevotella sp.]|nr:hypothetical protein [Alloprevotella sp.]MBR1651758.1 hypothetical protein [Alloprevotella sp.]